MSWLRNLHRRRQSGERGAGMVEMALVVPLLFALVVGLFEFGIAWRNSLSVSNALRSGARAGANAGDNRTADYDLLLAVTSSMAKIHNAEIERVVVFKSNGSSGEPPSTCLTASAAAAGGISSGSYTSGVRCNVYDAADLASLSPTQFGGTTSCSATAIDRFWCPTSRNDSQSSAQGPDYLGVWIEVDHEYATNLFGSGITITDRTVTRLEPEVQ